MTEPKREVTSYLHNRFEAVHVAAEADRSTGCAYCAGTGNFNIPHRLNSDERPVYEAAKKKVSCSACLLLLLVCLWPV